VIPEALIHDPVAILGLGYTTERLARRLRARGISVYVAKTAEHIPPGAILVHSIPPLAEPDNSVIHALITAIQPPRILYISSTGVYGSQTDVDETTPASPNDEKGFARLAEEEWLADPAFPGRSTLILRSAAIYGPGRGVHMRLREGKLPRGAGGTISRIHVDDLVSILEAGIASELEGAWPVADERPALSEEVVAWCADHMGIALPEGATESFPVSGRRVDGRKVRELLGVALEYPSYRTGIPASLLEE
jgi:nucleoside-diphosphate-sugar epimerase